MKKIILAVIVAAFFTLNTHAQTSKEVTLKVKTAFAQKFPTATKAKWDRENEKEWEVEFKMEGRSYSANYDNEGNWMETEYAITNAEIPAAVQSSLDKDFAGYRINASEISETVDGKVYEFILKKTGEKIEVAFDINGKLKSKEDVTKENEEEK